MIEEPWLLPGPRTQLHRDCDEVRAAITLVERGSATRVLVAGLTHPAQAILLLRRTAAETGLVLEGRVGEDGDLTAVLVRRGPTLVR